MVLPTADSAISAPPDPADAAAALLAQLRDAHASLALAMRVLEELTCGSLADRERYAAARWRISQASLSRRTLWGKIYRHLIAGVGLQDAAVLNDLQADEMRMLHCSAAHVGRWTMAAIDQDWPGYCRASEVVRGQLSARTDNERRLLYPMLERLSRARGNGPPRPAANVPTHSWADRITATRTR
ncbi:MAG TPA: hypothetical protein VMN38_04570 [Sphingomicrobium sp.]|nr:hypothetical protein [Sphingomicrobium sp.]